MKNLSYYNRRLRIVLVLLVAVVACIEGQGWGVAAAFTLYLTVKFINAGDLPRHNRPAKCDIALSP